MYEYRYGVGRITREEKEEGYIDTFTRTYQVFYVDIFIKKGIFKIKIERKTLFQEEIPQDVLLDIACLGSTDWKTSCPDEFFEKCDQKVIETK